MHEVRNFLDLDLIDAATPRRIIDVSARIKASGERKPLLANHTLAMVFEKPSTRTRVSFDVAMQTLGGGVVSLEPNGSQLGRGETLADTARILSEYVDVIMFRTSSIEKLEEMVEAATVPVINGLTDRSHPCQIMADVMTFEEKVGPIAGRIVAWSGDSNNVANSWIHAAVQFGFEFRVASPSGLQPPQDILDWAAANGGRVSVGDDPVAAVAGADCVVTDTWVSMGDNGADRRRALLSPYRVDEGLMGHAADGAVFMHCLPVYRGDEATTGVVDGPQSVVWTEAGNRLHAQKGILLWCLHGNAAFD
ncbi:MAG: ornithine carbamoyltransferase [Alphaproteobacteria bacterium]|nr:ornithine carbamoyltransferase [Alphaproteobacteria bacterium]